MQDAEYNTKEERNRLHAIARNLGSQRKRVINRVKARSHMALRIMAHHGDVPTLLFHESTEDVDRLSQMTPHLNAAVYHSNHPSKDSELERFKNKGNKPSILMPRFDRGLQCSLCSGVCNDVWFKCTIKENTNSGSLFER